MGKQEARGTKWEILQLRGWAASLQLYFNSTGQQVKVKESLEHPMRQNSGRGTYINAGACSKLPDVRNPLCWGISVHCVKL